MAESSTERSGSASIVIARSARLVVQDLIVPVPDAREAFDDLHRRLDLSHRRAFVEAELAALVPDGAELTYAATIESRYPVSIAYTAQSDVEGAESALRAELEGVRSRPRAARRCRRDHGALLDLDAARDAPAGVTASPGQV